MSEGSVKVRSSQRILSNIAACRRASYLGPGRQAHMSAAVGTVFDKGLGYEGSRLHLDALELPFVLTRSTFVAEKKHYKGIANKSEFILGRFSHGGKRTYVSKRTSDQKVLKNKQKVARMLDVRKLRNFAVLDTNVTDTCDGYLSKVFEFPPVIVDASGLFTEHNLEYEKLVSLGIFAFSDKNTYATSRAPDNSLINDNYQKSTGQRRRVFRDFKVARREFGEVHAATKDNRLWITKDSLDKDFGDEASVIIDKVSEIAMKLLRARLDQLKITVAEGFPKALDTEFMGAPIGAEAQHVHGDSRHNIVTMALRLSLPGQDVGRKSTWYAADFETSFRRDRTDRMRDYKLMQFDLEPGPCFTLSHAGHPHKGPGTLNATEPRYLIFFAFALDEVAYHFSTTEDVHRWVISDTLEKEKNPDDEEKPALL
jgi:hypothetical protein